MEINTILLLLLAAFIHSIWNMLAKKSIDKQTFLWLSLIVFCTMLFIPFMFIYKGISSIGWTFIIVSGFLEAIYYFILGSAYQQGELSLVYPLARGSAPLFVTLIASLFLNEKIASIGYMGILVVIIGIYIVNLKVLDKKGIIAPIISIREKAPQLAILTGLVIASYSVVDKIGVSYVEPLVYIYMIFLAASLILTPYMIMRKREIIIKEWKINRLKIIAVSVLNAGSYFLVLTAMTSSKVSYVSTVREVSIVFAALIGTLFLKEKFADKKIIGAVLIFLGIILIAITK